MRLDLRGAWGLWLFMAAVVIAGAVDLLVR
jgi:hypothetical protein